MWPFQFTMYAPLVYSFYHRLYIFRLYELCYSREGYFQSIFSHDISLWCFTYLQNNNNFIILTCFTVLSKWNEKRWTSTWKVWRPFDHPPYIRYRSWHSSNAALLACKKVTLPKSFHQGMERVVIWCQRVNKTLPSLHSNLQKSAPFFVECPAHLMLWTLASSKCAALRVGRKE